MLRVGADEILNLRLRFFGLTVAIVGISQIQRRLLRDLPERVAGKQLGIMFEKDAAKAMELYEKACGGNVYSTCAQAGLQYIKEFDDKKAEELLTKACDNRVSLGCSGLGVLYRMTDKEKGVVYFQKACDTGENEWAACKGAGEDYYSLGRKEMAKKYLKKACDLGKEHIGVKYDPDLKKSWQEACDLYITIK